MKLDEVVQHGDGLRFADGSDERPAHEPWFSCENWGIWMPHIHIFYHIHYSYYNITWSQNLLTRKSSYWLEPRLRYTVWKPSRMRWHTWVERKRVTSSSLADWQRIWKFVMQVFKLTLRLPMFPSWNRFNLGQAPTKYFRQGFPERQRSSLSCRTADISWLKIFATRQQDPGKDRSETHGF